MDRLSGVAECGVTVQAQRTLVDRFLPGAWGWQLPLAGMQAWLSLSQVMTPVDIRWRSCLRTRSGR